MKRYAVSSVLVIAAMASALRAETLEECAAIADDAQRVSCYDRVAGRDPSKPASADAAACEAALVQRLVAPATYKRIDITETRIPMSLDEYVDKKLLEIRDRHVETPDLATPERAALREEEARIKQAGILCVETVLIWVRAEGRRNPGL
ncbi:hypothetical protein [Sinorhizobium medicae]